MAGARDAMTSTSGYIAGSVNRNPVVIRRLLGLLRQAGFVSSKGGAGGGWALSTDPDSLTIAEVRRAVNEGSPFAYHSRPPNPACPIGRNIQSALGRVYNDAERAMEKELGRTTISQLLLSVQSRKRK